MANLLQLQKGSKSFGPRRLFDEAQFAINEGEHVGVIGPNGAGKTTLFRILTAQESLDDGILVKAKNLQLGYLAQHDNWRPDETVESYLSEGCRTPLWELQSLGHGLGLTDDIFSRPIMSLSGGYRMRCKLLYLIGQEPNLMLLDEPTNYLDLETTLVLEKFLQGYKGAFLLISHDREFLRRTTDHILEVEQGDITKFNGNIDDYFEQKTLLRAQLEARAMSLKEKKEEVLKFVARFGAKASKASQAQSRLKTLDKMETIELKALPVSATIRIPPPVRTGKLITTIENADMGYGEKVILKNVNFKFHNSDHIAVVGLNGAGKSTFLKVLARTMAPLSGKLELGLNVTIGYYAQHVAESLNSNSTVIDEMLVKAHKDITRQDALNMAGSLLFSGDDIKKKVSVLSGGEKSRVALGQILLQKAPCLVLDEPTNHLDFQTVEALTQALMKYEGTVAVVSHDRSFIRRVGTKILEINHGQVTVYPGTYDEYVWSLEKGALALRTDPRFAQDDEASSNNKQPSGSGADSGAGPGTSDGKSNANYKETKKALDRQLKQCEKALADLDINMTALQKKVVTLNGKIGTTPGSQLSQVISELTETQQKLNALEAEWLTMGEKKEETILALQKLTTA